MISDLSVVVLSGGGGHEHDISLRSADLLVSQLKGLGLKSVESVVLENGLNLTHNNAPLAWSDLKADIIFPCLHGFPGETGDYQSLATLFKQPFIGAKASSHRLCFNKVSTKLWLKHWGIPTADFIALTPHDINDEASTQRQLAFKKLENWKGECFIKAAEQGSSVGCYPCTKKEDFIPLVTEALKYSSQVLVEEIIEGRELEVAAIETPQSLEFSHPGEILNEKDFFYDYEQKYSSSSRATTVVQAKELTEESLTEIKNISKQCWDLFDLKGPSRIDFFFTKNGQVLVNEINTIPGMTSISLFPKMIEAHGLEFSQYLRGLIEMSLKKA